MGVTTATASVTPAPSPAVCTSHIEERQKVLLYGFGAAAVLLKTGRRTDEDVPDARHSCLFVRQPVLVGFKARKTDSHLWYDAGQDGS